MPYKSSPTRSNSWWSFKLFKPWSSRWWLPYPVHEDADVELGQPSAELMRGAEALREMAPMASAALPWIKEASKRYASSVFPMLACAEALAKEMAEIAGALPCGEPKAMSSRDFLIHRLEAPEGWAIYCERRPGLSPAGFVGMAGKKVAFGLPMGAAALFASEEDARRFAKEQDLPGFALARTSVAVTRLDWSEAGVDVSPVQELAARRERSDLQGLTGNRGGGPGDAKAGSSPVAVRRL